MNAVLGAEGRECRACNAFGMPTFFTAGAWNEPARLSRLPSMQPDPGRRPPVGMPRSSKEPIHGTLPT